MTFYTPRYSFQSSGVFLINFSIHSMLFKLIASTPRFLMNYKAPGNVYDSPKITLGILNCTMKALLNKSGKTDVLLVPGDVNYILSGVLTAQKKVVKKGHVESALRSYIRTMPE